MFTRERPAEPHESFGLSDEQQTEDTTVIEIFLEDSDLKTAKENRVLTIPDPTVDGALIAAAYHEINIEREGGISATPAFGDNQIARVRKQKRTPVEYSTCHIDGGGDSTYGTVLQFFHASEF